MPPAKTLGELIVSTIGVLSQAELKVARVLLADYPVAGLETVARLAERADVSGPTVVRFATRLGFNGFPELQRALHAEIQARMSTPLSMYDRRAPAAESNHNLLETSRDYSLHNIQTTFEGLAKDEFDAVVQLLSDTRLRILSMGGRASESLAYYLYVYLHAVRPGIRLLGWGPTPRLDEVVDLDRRDVLCVFDYRRYQKDTIECADRAAERGGTVILFTDHWLSPIASVARHILTSSVESSSPFDSSVAALAVVEAVVTGVIIRLGSKARARIEETDRVQPNFAWAKLPPDNSDAGARGRRPQRTR